MSKKVILIKLGGSVITNKESPMELRHEVLTRLVDEIRQARLQRPDVLFVVGHGSGSFGHVPASQYGTMHGFKDAESVLGMAIVQDSAAQLNRLVVRAFLDAGIPAVSLLPSNSLITRKRVAERFFSDVFEEYIKNGLFPITQGDVLIDTEQGCTIWSTEEVLAFFAQEFIHRGWEIEQIIHVTEVPGVLDAQGSLFSRITSTNWNEVQQAIYATKGFDVTGGMGLKVRESLELAKKGVVSKIISGLQPANLQQALLGQEWYGTEITA